MTDLDIVKSTCEGKTSEENEGNQGKYLATNASCTETRCVPYAGTSVGFKAISQNVFNCLTTEWSDYKFTLEDYLADSNKVVAFGTYSGTHIVTGKYFEARVAHLWVLSNGKVIRFEQFIGSKTVKDAMK